MITAIYLERSLRHKLLAVLIVIMIPLAWWPGGEYFQNAVSPSAWWIWTVIVVPAIVMVYFAINAYMNLQDDESLEAESTSGGSKPQTASTDGSGGER